MISIIWMCAIWMKRSLLRGQDLSYMRYPQSMTLNITQIVAPPFNYCRLWQSTNQTCDASSYPLKDSSLLLNLFCIQLWHAISQPSVSYLLVPSPLLPFHKYLLFYSVSLNYMIMRICLFLHSCTFTSLWFTYTVLSSHLLGVQSNIRPFAALWCYWSWDLLHPRR